MTKILLVCSAGMSTSILCEKMIKAGKDIGVELQVDALAMAAAKSLLNNYDVILLGPQVKFIEKEIRSLTDKKVDIIPGNLYALAKGKEVLAMAFKMLEEK